MRAAARIVPIVALAGLVVAGTLLDRDLDPPPEVVYGSATVAPMPVAPTGTPLSSSWFCPGVPGAGTEGATGTVSVLNASNDPLQGTLTVYPTEGEPVSTALVVRERSRTDVRIGDVTPAPWAAAVVEMLGADGVVEQSVTGPTGRSAAACSNSASSSWYLAEGATTLDASLQLLLFNPFPDDAIVDISFATSEGTRTPQALQGLPVRGRSLRVLPLDEVVRREPTLATSVQARSGRVVVGRDQRYTQGSKRAFSVGLASPAPAEQWWFAAGDKGNQAVVERLSIYNPGEADAEVDVSFFPADPASAPLTEPISVTVPASTAVSVDVSAAEGVPAGPHSILVLSEPEHPVVAERVLELQGDAALNVTLQPGTPLTSTDWLSPTGAPGGSEVLVVANTTGQEGTFSVLALGPAGFTPVTGLASIALPAAGVARVDLDQAGVAGQPLAVSSTAEVAVERIAGAPAGQPGISITRAVPVLPAG